MNGESKIRPLRPPTHEPTPEEVDAERRRFMRERIAIIRESLDALESAMGVRVEHHEHDLPR